MTESETYELNVLNFFRVMNDWASTNEMTDDFRRSGITVTMYGFQDIINQQYLKSRLNEKGLMEYRISEYGQIRLNRLIAQSDTEQRTAHTTIVNVGGDVHGSQIGSHSSKMHTSINPPGKKSLLENAYFLAGIGIFILTMVSVMFSKGCFNANHPIGDKSDSSHFTKNDNSTNAPVDRSVHETTVIKPYTPPKPMSPKPRHLNNADKKILDTITADYLVLQEENRYASQTNDKDSETDVYANEMLTYLSDHHHHVTCAQMTSVAGPPPNANGRFYIHGNEINIYRLKK